MAKKSKSKKAARARGEFLYEAFSSKIETSKYREKVADKEVESHLPVVLQCLLKFENPIALDKLVEKIKDTKRYRTKSNLAKWVRVDLGILVSEGLVKATKVEKDEVPVKRPSRKLRSLAKAKNDAIGREADAFESGIGATA